MSYKCVTEDELKIEILLEACNKTQTKLMNMSNSLGNQDNGRRLASISLLAQAIKQAE